MAEDENGQEKTEEPTGRRIEKAREEGQVPRSKELGTTFLLIAGAAGLLIFGEYMGNVLRNIMYSSFSFRREMVLDSSQMGIHLINAAVEIAQGILPFLVVLFFAAIAGSLALGGWLISTKSITPKLSNLNPIKGLGKIVSMKSLVELVKAFAKVGLVMAIALIILNMRIDDLLGLADQNIITAMTNAAYILGWSFLFLSCGMIVISFIDVPFQMFDHKKNLRMTKQEIKDEFKEMEGKPEVKRKIRQLQMEMTQRRMMQDIPQADVVITNPTHYSVALKYKPEEDAAPILVAKGHDQIALKIREIANEHDIEIVEAPPLARSVYHHSEIGQEIPSGLYMAVAQVLAYVFQIKQFKRRIIPRPTQPDFPIPDDLKYDG